MAFVYLSCLNQREYNMIVYSRALNEGELQRLPNSQQIISDIFYWKLHIDPGFYVRPIFAREDEVQ